MATRFGTQNAASVRVCLIKQPCHPVPQLTLERILSGLKREERLTGGCEAGGHGGLHGDLGELLLGQVQGLAYDGDAILLRVPVPVQASS